MRHLICLYILIILISVFYFFAIENVTGGTFSLDKGGRDHVFSFYDVTLFLVLILAAALTIVSLMAYRKKESKRLFFVSFAFFLFSIKSALQIIDNFVIGGYGYMGITTQTLELLILLSLFYAIFRK